MYNGQKPSVPLTLHVRLTKACNADCSYCSSWQESPDQRMSVEEFKKSIRYIHELLIKLRLGTTHIEIQYLGGEILLIPQKELNEMVEYSRKYLRGHGYNVRDGVQTNMIGSEKRLQAMNMLFEGRIGTSIDSFSDNRTVNGSVEQYRVFFKARDAELSIPGMGVPAIFTMDAKCYQYGLKEAQKANQEGRNLVVKGVFEGGRAVEIITKEAFSRVMLQILDDWFMNYGISIEPFNSMLKRYLQKKHGYYMGEVLQQCHFQADCASRSLDLEPNGDLYICQDLADKNIGLLGNTLTEEFDFKLWSTINERPDHLHETCLKCPYLAECQGGCMVDAFEAGLSYYDKTHNCLLWKDIYGYFHDKIDIIGHKSVHRWIRRLNNK